MAKDHPRSSTIIHDPSRRVLPEKFKLEFGDVRVRGLSSQLALWKGLGAQQREDDQGKR